MFTGYLLARVGYIFSSRVLSVASAGVIVLLIAGRPSIMSAVRKPNLRGERAFRIPGRVSMLIFGN